MKIFLIILCAFLLRAEADAQTWQKISPDSLNEISKVKVLKDKFGDRHIFCIFGYRVINFLAHTKDGKNWDFTKSMYVGTCRGPHTLRGPISSVFKDIIDFDFNEILVELDYLQNRNCYGNPELNEIGRESNPVIGIPLDNFAGYNQNSMARIYSRPFFDLRKTYIREMKLFYTNNGDSLIFTDNNRVKVSSIKKPERKYSTNYYPSILYINPQKKNNLYISYYLGDLYRSSDNAKTWESMIVGKLDSNNIPRFTHITFPAKDNDSNNYILVNTYTDIWLINNDTKTIDTVLQPQSIGTGNSPFFREITFLENSDLAYVGTETGKIYRSSDAGKTWSLFPTNFSDKPVIAVHAFGIDSLIVGTEDGIWANYALPVSVAEEIPFKNNELTITPNPANTSLKISFLKTDLQQLSIYNSLGQLVFKTEFSGEFVWDFKNDIPDGVYSVAVQCDGKSVAKQIVILK